MPVRPGKVCGFGVCHHVAESGNRYCNQHKDNETGWGRHQVKHGNSNQRGYGYAWRKLRNIVLIRDNFICVNHSKRLNKIVPANQVDHIIPKAEGGTDDESNLQSLCALCHSEKTELETGRGRGRVKSL